MPNSLVRGARRWPCDCPARNIATLAPRTWPDALTWIPPVDTYAGRSAAAVCARGLRPTFRHGCMSARVAFTPLRRLFQPQPRPSMGGTTHETRLICFTHHGAPTHRLRRGGPAPGPSFRRWILNPSRSRRIPHLAHARTSAIEDLDGVRKNRPVIDAFLPSKISLSMQCRVGRRCCVK